MGKLLIILSVLLFGFAALLLILGAGAKDLPDILGFAGLGAFALGHVVE